jgi:hypothetical protein
MVLTTIRSGSLEDLVIYNPATRRQQDEMGLLLVTPGCDDMLTEFIDTSLSRGHSIARLPNLSVAAEYVRMAYLDGVLIDVARNLTLPDSPFVNDIKELQRQVDFTRKGAPVMLIDSSIRSSDDLVDESGQLPRYNQSNMVRLTNAGAWATTRLVVLSGVEQEILAPFSISSAKPGERPADLEIIFSRLASRFEENRARRDELFKRTVEYGKQGPHTAVLPLAVGSAVRDLYLSDRSGGAPLFEVDSHNHISTRVLPEEQYPPGALLLHSKRENREHATAMIKTWQFLIKQRPDRKMPTPLGTTEGGDSFALYTFLPGTDYGVLMRNVDPGNYEIRPEKKQVISQLRAALLDELFNRRLPEWHADVHKKSLSEDYREARANLPGKRAAQMNLLPHHAKDVLGRSLNSARLSEYEKAAAIILGNPLPDDLFQIPMDPKPANIALLTGMGAGGLEFILDTYAPRGKILRQRISDDFCHWDYLPFPRITTYLEELHQAGGDPAMMLCPKEQFLMFRESLTALVGQDGFMQYLPLLLQEGIPKAAVKAYVTAELLQTDELKRAVMKTTDPVAYQKRKDLLQERFGFFVSRVLAMTTAYARCEQEDWKSADEGVVIDRLGEHFSDQERWRKIHSLGGNQSELIGALGVVHNVFKLDIGREMRLNEKHLRDNALYGKMLIDFRK